MKQTLELRHLAPYLPYGLRVKHVQYENEPFELVGIKKTGVILHGDWSGGTHHTYGNSEYGFDSIKLRLHPLDRLTQEITVEGYNDGNPFNPMIELARMDWFTEEEWGEVNFKDFTFDTSHLYRLCHQGEEILWLNSTQITIHEYWVVTQLIEWHFDVFYIIKEGLALPIVTTNK